MTEERVLFFFPRSEIGAYLTHAFTTDTPIITKAPVLRVERGMMLASNRVMAASMMIYMYKLVRSTMLVARHHLLCPRHCIRTLLLSPTIFFVHAIDDCASKRRGKMLIFQSLLERRFDTRHGKHLQKFNVCHQALCLSLAPHGRLLGQSAVKIVKVPQQS